MPPKKKAKGKANAEPVTGGLHSPLLAEVLQGLASAIGKELSFSGTKQVEAELQELKKTHQEQLALAKDCGELVLSVKRDKEAKERALDVLGADKIDTAEIENEVAIVQQSFRAKIAELQSLLNDQEAWVNPERVNWLRDVEQHTSSLQELSGQESELRSKLQDAKNREEERAREDAVLRQDLHEIVAKLAAAEAEAKAATEAADVAALKQQEKLSKTFHVDPQAFDSEWDRTYFEDSEVVLDRGGKPYYLPAGWTRFALRLEEFDNRFDGWHVAYHGTKVDHVCDSIIQFGLLKPGTTAGAKLLRHSSACDASSVLVSPSIQYAALASKSPTFPPSPCFQLASGKWAQAVFQTRVRPGSFTEAGSSLPEDFWPANRLIDTHYKANEGLEWTLQDPADAHVYGLMVRVLDHSPDAQIAQLVAAAPEICLSGSPKY